MTVDVVTQPIFMRPFHGVLQGIYERLCGEMNDIICVSLQQIPDFKKLNNRTHTISNPMDFRGDEAADTTRAGRFDVLYVGRLEPKKNVGYLLDAFKILVNQRANAELWIAGTGFEENKLRRQVRSMGLLDKVSFLGQVAHNALPALYTAADVFVQPSVLETQGLVVMEAMRFRRPVIVTNKIISAQDLVEEGKNGYIVDPHSPQDLADKPTHLYDTPALRRQMGEVAFNHFSIQTTEDVGEKRETIYGKKDRPATMENTILPPCTICGRSGAPSETTKVRCNVRRYRDHEFQVWRCHDCQSLQTEKVGNLGDNYQGYPLRNAKLDYFTRVWYDNFGASGFPVGPPLR